MKTPLISIILSTYNGSKYIKESIESVLKQTYTNFEFIIINDCSTDNVGDLILSYKKNDNRIIYIKNEKNLKLTSSLNKGLKKVKWKYIARIDDDDIWLKEKLEKQVNFMENNSDYGVCWTQRIDIDENWKELITHKKIIKNTEIKKIMLFWSQFSHSSILIRKKAIDELWWYNIKYNYIEDYELWLRIWTKYKLYNIPEKLLIYRFLYSSISRKNKIKIQLLWIKVIFKYSKYYPNFLKALFQRIIILIFPRKLINILVNIKNKI